MGAFPFDIGRLLYYNKITKIAEVMCLKKIWKLKRLWIFLLAPIALALNFAASRNAAFAEWYATVVYPVFSLSVNAVTSIFPFSLAEVFLAVLSLLFLLYIILTIINIAKKKGERPEIGCRFAVNVFCGITVLFFIYTISCGINYSRYQFAQTSGLTVQNSSKAELTALCDELVQKLNVLRSQVKTDNNSVMMLSQPSIQETAKQAQEAYDKISKDYPLLRAGYGPPKPVFFSHIMSYAQTTGIFFPFTFEANINIAVPSYSIPATMCHELSHLRGYMREDEANFISYLVCENSQNTDFAYSGNMLAFIYASNALFDTDSETAGKIYAKLSSGVQQDLSANTKYWKQFEGPVAQVSTMVNNSYLKANHQQDGVKSYGRMVDLLLAEKRQKATNLKK